MIRSDGDLVGSLSAFQYPRRAVFPEAIDLRKEPVETYLQSRILGENHPYRETYSPNDTGRDRAEGSLKQLYSLEEYSRREAEDLTAPLVQGASFDPLWQVKAGGENYEIGFAYIRLNGVMIPEGLVIRRVSRDEDCRFVPLAWLYGNEYVNPQVDHVMMNDRDSLFPSLQSTLSYGLPTSVEIEETPEKIKLKLEFKHPLEYVYSLKMRNAVPKVQETDKIQGSVEMTFFKNSSRMDIAGTREIKKRIVNHNGSNLIQEVVKGGESPTIGIGGYLITPAHDDKIASFQLEKRKGGRLISTLSFDKGVQELGRVENFQDYYTTISGNKATLVYIPDFSRQANRKAYRDKEGTTYPSNSLSMFRYNSFYDYGAKGFPSFKEPDNPLVVKVAASEGHLGEGWIGIPIEPGVYKDSVIILFDLPLDSDFGKIVEDLKDTSRENFPEPRRTFLRQ